MSKVRIIYLITVVLLLLIASVMLIIYVNMSFDTKYENIGIENSMNQMENEVDEELLAEYKSMQILRYLIITITCVVNILVICFTIYYHIKKEKRIY